MEVNPITEIIKNYQFHINGLIYNYPLVVIKEIKNFDLEEAKKLIIIRGHKIDLIVRYGQGNKYFFYFRNECGIMIIDKEEYREPEDSDDERNYVPETEEILYKVNVWMS